MRIYLSSHTSLVFSLRRVNQHYSHLSPLPPPNSILLLFVSFNGTHLHASLSVFDVFKNACARVYRPVCAGMCASFIRGAVLSLKTGGVLIRGSVFVLPIIIKTPSAARHKQTGSISLAVSSLLSLTEPPVTGVINWWLNLVCYKFELLLKGFDCWLISYVLFLFIFVI